MEPIKIPKRKKVAEDSDDEDDSPGFTSGRGKSRRVWRGRGRRGSHSSEQKKEGKAVKVAVQEPAQKTKEGVAVIPVNKEEGKVVKVAVQEPAQKTEEGGVVVPVNKEEGKVVEVAVQEPAQKTEEGVAVVPVNIYI